MLCGRSPYLRPWQALSRSTISLQELGSATIWFASRKCFKALVRASRRRGANTNANLIHPLASHSCDVARSTTNRFCRVGLQAASNKLDHNLQHWLVAVNAIKLMCHQIAAPGRGFFNWLGRAFICELIISRDHKLLHGALLSKNSTAYMTWHVKVD